MRSRLATAALTAAVVVLTAFPLQAKLGIGVHWGFDWSVDVDDMRMEQLVFEDIQLEASGIGGTTPTGAPAQIPGDLLPIYIDRTDFQRTVVNFGGKILIDALRYFEVEVSTNFGLWEYEGLIIYPRSMQWRNNVSYQDAQSPEDLYTIVYDTLAVTTESLDSKYWGLDKTPYAKIHFDATIRKTFLKFPKRLKTLSLYAGGGLSLHFATPVLSAELIENALGDQLDQAFSTVDALGSGFLGNEQIMTAVLDQITAGLSEPKWGIHFVAGTQIKIPVIPIAVYVDGKWMIPFGQMDEYVDVNGHGFLVNGGIMLKF
ncbi:MAG: hypothetical protein GF331_13770 [Chitinivibrionales bacterium]|nr:hypothetical protein [Chitinivibrionales bacterium]